MAKKFKWFRFRRLNLDESVSYLYKTGITQSCIINTTILLILSCIISVKDKPIKPICITFSESQPETEIDYTDVDQELVEIMPPQQIEQQDVVSESIKESVVSENIEITEFEEMVVESEVGDPMSDFNLDDIGQNLVVEKEKPDKVKPTRTGRRYTNNVQNNQQNGSSGGLALSGGGSDLAEMGRRLQEHGAQTGDIQISLSWNSVDDIDLHVMVMPIRSQINWTNKRSPCGGMLDIDMNAHPQMVSNRPVENVFWPNQQAPRGIYMIGIQNYMPWSRNLSTEVLMVVKVKGQIIKSQKIVARYGEGVKEIFRFNF